MNQQQVFARNAIEALRSGVPSRHAVERLGTTQSEIKGEFEARLQTIVEGQGVSPLVIAADFGQGKSHLLNYLRAAAKNQGFVTSFVIVSPEMPLGNPHIVLKALAEAAEAKDHTGRALRALARNLRTNSDEYVELKQWTDNAALDHRFSALLYLYEVGDEELRAQILSDFEGVSISIKTIREELKGQAASYAIKNKRVAVLAHDRIRLLARCFRACGAKGLVILFDELERFTLFSPKQRLAAWEQIGWWSQVASENGAAILPVFACHHEGIRPRAEEDEPQFRQRILPLDLDDPDRLGMAGIQLIKKPIRLLPLDANQEEEIQYRVKAIYEQAYDVQTSPIQAAGSNASGTIRSEIRRWITHWDLRRNDPPYVPEVVAEPVQQDTSEIKDESVIATDDPADIT